MRRRRIVLYYIWRYTINIDASKCKKKMNRNNFSEVMLRSGPNVKYKIEGDRRWGIYPFVGMESQNGLMVGVNTAPQSCILVGREENQEWVGETGSRQELLTQSVLITQHSVPGAVPRTSHLLFHEEVYSGGDWSSDRCGFPQWHAWIEAELDFSSDWLVSRDVFLF